MSVSQAIAAGDVALLPSRRDEDWRWTDLRGLIRAMPPVSPASDRVYETGACGDGDIMLVNGVVRGDVKALVVPAGERRNVRLRVIADANHTAHGADLSVEVGEGAELTLLETYEGLGEGYLTETRLNLTVDADARLERVVLAADAAESVAVSTATVALSRGSRFEQTVLTTGARRQRIETRIVHPGEGATVRMDGGYLLDGQRHADLTTAVAHEGVGGETSQLTKGIVRDQARGVFQGRIVVERGADKTDARMGHHALILSEKAEIDAKPELLIYADDVSCAHGNTVGALDEDALFYARQRGIPDDQARAMLAEAFVGEVVDRITNDEARDVARQWVATHLGAV
ncbi:MAG: Fe-S cluster assembly protein SufD [Caulobacter sp.]